MAVFSLLSGMAVYFLFRNTAMLLFAWFPKLAWLNRVYIRLNPKENIFLSIALYSIPDGLWLLSGLCGIRALWWSDQKTGGVYAAGFCLLALCFDTLQMVDSVPGTFDVIDLAVLVFFAFLEGAMFRCFIKRSMS